MAWNGMSANLHFVWLKHGGLLQLEVSRVGPFRLRKQEWKLLCLRVLDGSSSSRVPFLKRFAGRLDHLELKTERVIRDGGGGGFIRGQWTRPGEAVRLLVSVREIRCA